MKTQSSVSYADTLEMLFSNRNRAYGAYQLRRQYPNALAKALGLTLLLIALLMLLPTLLKAISSIMPNEKTIEDIPREITRVEIEQPPQPKIQTPPPPPHAAQQYIPPLVLEDNKVTEDPPQISNEELIDSKAQIGAENSEGPVEGPPTLDDPGPGSAVETQASEPKDDPYEFVDLQKAPVFPGGESELMKYLAKNISYPNLAREANIQGVVVLSFIIGKDGSISDITVLRDLGGGCTKEAMRVVKSMPPWSPGEANGHPVKVRFVLPVRFKLT